MRRSFVSFRQRRYRAVEPIGEDLIVSLGQLGRSTVKPADDNERWAIQEWLAWDNQRMSGGPALLRYLKRWVPETDPAVLRFTEARAVRALDQLSAGLQRSGWLVGDRPTIADIAACAYAFWLDEAGLDSGRWPAITGWLSRIEKLPGFARPASLMPVA